MKDIVIMFVKYQRLCRVKDFVSVDEAAKARSLFTFSSPLPTPIHQSQLLAMPL
jgi:hypothetical protein